MRPFYPGRAPREHEDGIRLQARPYLGSGTLARRGHKSTTVLGWLRSARWGNTWDRQGLLDPQTETRISLAEADPDLLRGLDEVAAEQARAVALVDLISFDAGGVWEPSIEASRALYGLFVVDGLLSRGVVIEGRRAAELLGPGDVLRPFTSESVDPSVAFTIDWEVLQPTTLALLDRGFAEAVAPWPEISAALMDRMVGRAHALAFHLAVSHLK